MVHLDERNTDGMTNFEKITRSPETLAELLGSMEVLDGPWDHDFARAFCDNCEAGNCAAENCEHMAERDNPLWWLMQEAKEEQA